MWNIFKNRRLLVYSCYFTVAMFRNPLPWTISTRVLICETRLVICYDSRLHWLWQMSRIHVWSNSRLLQYMSSKLFNQICILFSNCHYYTNKYFQDTGSLLEDKVIREQKCHKQSVQYLLTLIRPSPPPPITTNIISERQIFKSHFGQFY